MLLPEPPKESQ